MGSYHSKNLGFYSEWNEKPLEGLSREVAWFDLDLGCFGPCFVNDIKFTLSGIYKYQVNNSESFDESVNPCTTTSTMTLTLPITSEGPLMPVPGNPPFPKPTTVMYHVRFVLPMVISEIVHYTLPCAWVLSVNSVGDLSDLGFNMITRDTVLRTDCRIWGWGTGDRGMKWGHTPGLLLK